MSSAAQSLAKVTTASIPLLIPKLPTLSALTPYLSRIDANHWYSNFGPLVRELQGRLGNVFAAETGRMPEIVTVSNATIGLELALRALELPAGSRVLVPAFTFVATAAAVVSAGLVPMCADIDPETWQLTPRTARDAAKRADIRAVLPVCVFGCEQSAAGWKEFHAETGIPVVIDAAASFGNQWDPGPTCAVFSMHATKPLSAGEGGFLVTQSSDMAASVRQRSNFGINLTHPELSPIGAATVVGVNGKLSEYHAAVGHASLDAWPENARSRRVAYSEYVASLSRAAGGRIAWQKASMDTVRSVCAFLMPSQQTRDRAEASFASAGISTRRWYCPTVDRHPAFHHFEHFSTPIAHAVADRLLGVPFYPELDVASRDVVSDVLAKSLAAH